MTDAELLAISHRLQSWRPDALTLEHAATMPDPFCIACADWHAPTELCSLTTEDDNA